MIKLRWILIVIINDNAYLTSKIELSIIIEAIPLKFRIEKCVTVNFNRSEIRFSIIFFIKESLPHHADLANLHKSRRATTPKLKISITTIDEKIFGPKAITARGAKKAPLISSISRDREAARARAPREERSIFARCDPDRQPPFISRTERVNISAAQPQFGLF